MSEPDSIKIRPYARLLTMLGDQLIRNERVALMELIKNAYDADSAWVRINFERFDDKFIQQPDAKITIEDAGEGMSEDVIRNHLAHPATPEKKLRKKRDIRTKKGRVIQGEKGIGRFAILKLGRKISIITRQADEPVERVVDYDFTAYDDEFLTKDGQDVTPFIDDLTISLREREPEVFVGERTSKKLFHRLDHGTLIEISALNAIWSQHKVERVYDDVARLQSIFADLVNPRAATNSRDKFEVRIERNHQALALQEEYKETLLRLMAEKAVLKIENGEYDEHAKEFRFDLNGKPKRFSLFDAEISGLTVFNERFGEGASKLKSKETECGSFRFGFYAFDFRPGAPPKYALDKGEKEILKKHRIYLYRDGIRVFPYGEPEDDWLSIDVDRGTKAASEFLSNDQVVGFVDISQEANPKLMDKTNREGLIEYGNATEDFRVLLRTILKYLRKSSYKEYLEREGLRKRQAAIQEGRLIDTFARLKTRLQGDKASTELLTDIERFYNVEKQYLVRRAETTEELAGVGISVETASHDIMLVMHKAMAGIDGLIKDLIGTDDPEDAVIQMLQSIRGALAFVEAQLKDVQLLFKSSKQRSRSIRVATMLEKVELIYRRILKNNKIKLTINSLGSPLVAKTTDAVLLQLLINLFDNAVYWLSNSGKSEGNILITLSGDDGFLIFSDDGPGVPPDDVPYIFEPFYSGKGQEGRGLGLYIARQLLERYDYTIELAGRKSERILPGANFVIRFVSEE